MAWVREWDTGAYVIARGTEHQHCPYCEQEYSGTPGCEECALPADRDQLCSCGELMDDMGDQGYCSECAALIELERAREVAA